MDFTEKVLDDLQSCFPFLVQLREKIFYHVAKLFQSYSQVVKGQFIFCLQRRRLQASGSD
jgi:hypothetical protein